MASHFLSRDLFLEGCYMEAPRSRVQEHLSAPLCTTRTQVYVDEHFCSLLLGLKQKKPKILMTCLSGSHKLAVFLFCSSACIFCCICWRACSSYVQSSQRWFGNSISQSLPRQPFQYGRHWFLHTNLLPSVRRRASRSGRTVLQKAQQTFVLSSMEIYKVQCSSTGAMQI